MPPWYRIPPAPAGDVVVVGAGLAGCQLVHELASLGRGATLVEAADAPATGASGNPVGIVKPFVTREPSPGERFHADAWRHLLTLLADDALANAARYRPTGALQLVEGPWPPRDDCERLDANAAERRGGVALDAPAGALAFEGAGSVDPRALCETLLRRARERLSASAASRGHRGASPAARLDERYGRRLDALERVDGRWRLHLRGPEGAEALDADIVVLANGPALVDTPWTRWLPVTPARGQMSRFAGGPVPRCTVAGRSWAVPDGDGVWAGATYERDDVDPEPRRADDEANRRALAALLPGSSPDASPSAASAGVRATTPDRLPFAGPVPRVDDAMARYADLARGRPPRTYGVPDYVPGLAALGGFGSRGLVTSGWCARLLARWLCGEAEGLQAATPLVGPLRFVVRPLVRGRAPRLRAPEPAA